MIKSRRMPKILCGLLTVFMVFGLMACTTTSDPADSKDPVEQDPVNSQDPVDSQEPDEDIELQFLYIWPEHEETMNETIALFEKEHSNISVDVSVVPWNEVNRTLQTAFATGDAPDVAFMWPNNMGNYVSIDAAMDLTPYMDADPDWANSFVSEDALRQGVLDDKLYAVPFRATATFIVYNVGLFKEHGWTVPETREEMAELADEMLSKDITPFALPGRPTGFQVKALSGYFIEYELQEDGILDDPQYIARRKTDIEGPYARGFEGIKSWFEKGYFGDNPFAIAREEAQSAFFTERGAMLMANNNELSDLRTNASDFEIGFMAFPGPQSSDTTLLHNAGFDGFFVNADTEYPDEAVAMLKSLTSPESQSLWADKALSIMPVKGVTYTDSDLQHMADIFSKAGIYRQIADFNVADLNDMEGESFVEYMLSDSITAEELEATYMDLLKDAITDN